MLDRELGVLADAYAAIDADAGGRLIDPYNGVGAGQILSQHEVEAASEAFGDYLIANCP